MAFDPSGEQGLRRRLKIALTPHTNYPSVAATLGVDEQFLRDYVDNPQFILPAETYLQIIDRLPLLPMRVTTHQGSQGFVYTYYEKPQWTQADIDALSPPFGSLKVASHFFEATYPDEVETAGPDDLDTFTLQQHLDSAIGGDPDLLMAVIFYAQFVDYPFYPSI